MIVHLFQQLHLVLTPLFRLRHLLRVLLQQLAVLHFDTRVAVLLRNHLQFFRQLLLRLLKQFALPRHKITLQLGQLIRHHAPPLVVREHIFRGTLEFREFWDFYSSRKNGECSCCSIWWRLPVSN